MAKKGMVMMHRRLISKKPVVFQLILLIFLSLVIKDSFADFKGEKIRYAIFPAGTAEYKDEGLVDFGNRKAGLVTFRTRMAGFDDLERIYSDPDTLLPLKVERDVSILLRKEYLIEDYASEINTLTITKFVKNKKVKEYLFKSDGPIYNAVTLPFYLRTVPDLKVGWTFTVSFPEKFQITLSSIEDIEVPAGKFKAYYFTSSPSKFEIWISCDERRIPLKIKGMGIYKYSMVMKKYFPEG